MGDSGASGVVGAFAIVIIFGLAVLLGIAFVLTLGLQRGRIRIWSVVIGILLLPFLIIVGLITYDVIKADNEVRLHRQEDEQRKLHQK